jgi:hypothetical protein
MQAVNITLHTNHGKGVILESSTVKLAPLKRNNQWGALQVWHDVGS